MVWSTTAAGTINQIARGFCSLLAKSSSEEVPTAFSWVSSLTAFGDLSKTTHWWPPLIRRRTIFAPILPRPIIPSCIVVPFQPPLGGSVIYVSGTIPMFLRLRDSESLVNFFEHEDLPEEGYGRFGIAYFFGDENCQ